MSAAVHSTTREPRPATDGERPGGGPTDSDPTDSGRANDGRANGGRANGGRTDGSRTDGSRTDGSRTDGSPIDGGRAAAARACHGSAALLLAALVAAVGAATPVGAPAIPPGEAALRLNPNTATRAELMLLPGIGPALADNIIAYRQRAIPPAFTRPEDLDRVHRIGPVTIERVRDMLTFELEPPIDPATRQSLAAPARGTGGEGD